MPLTELTVTEDHMKLLRRSAWQYNRYTEWGGVEQDPKRPFGNSGVLGDIREILGRDVPQAEARQLCEELAPIVEVLVRSYADRDVHPTECGEGLKLRRDARHNWTYL